MSTGLIRATVFASVAILLTVPSAVTAQTVAAGDNTAAVQTPVAHQHDHGSPTVAVKTETQGLCRMNEPSSTSHEAETAAPPAPKPQQEATTTPDMGRRGGMMTNMKTDHLMADQDTMKEGHSCCCNGMKM
jgi:hypothetical protein